MLLEKIYKNTANYSADNHKKTRKNIAQFFTPIEIARYMASQTSISKSELTLLDAGAGTGILACSLLEYLACNTIVKKVQLDLYENDNTVLPVLYNNIEILQEYLESKNISINISIMEKNFILDNESSWITEGYIGKYDVIISNPPYKKISRKSEEAEIMQEVVHGQPNIYFLFMAMSAKLLKDKGELIYIVPRSWTSGLYSEKFRSYFAENTSINFMHLFISRKNVFTNESVLQETMIVKAIKSKVKNKTIVINSSNKLDKKSISSINVPYEISIREDNGRFIYLPTNEEELKVLKKMKEFSCSLEQLGYKLKTGKVVAFRSKDLIQSTYLGNRVPLFWANHFKEGKIKYPIESFDKQYIDDYKKSLLMVNSNYLFVKRFTSKDEKRRLQPAIYLSEHYDKYNYISTENHINYITHIDRELMNEEVYGLYAIFNSTLWDSYYRILNGSTQVNSNEINTMPLPDGERIKMIGSRLMIMKDISTKKCDDIIEEILFKGVQNED